MPEHEIMQLTDADMSTIQRLGNGQIPVSYDQLVELRAGTWEKAIRYEMWRDKLDRTLQSNDPRDARAKAEVNLALAQLNVLRHKDVQPGTVHQNAALTNLSIQYANEMFIGEQLMPVVPSNKISDVYYTYDKRDRLGYPDDEIGPRGDANEINEGRSTGTYTCLGYAYKNYLDADTLFNQDAPLDEMVDLIEAVAEGLAFRRELRIAAIMGATASFGSNTSAVSAANRWDVASGGTIIKDMQDGMAALWTGRGPSEVVFYSSLDVYNVIARNPAILDLYKYAGSSPGLATPDMIARFFGANRYLVGAARKDTANPGSTASYSRIWPDRFGIARVMRRPSKRNAAFGVTFRHKSVETTQWFDQTKGVRGGYFGKTAVSEVQKVLATDTDYLYDTPIG